MSQKQAKKRRREGRGRKQYEAPKLACHSTREKRGNRAKNDSPNEEINEFREWDIEFRSNYKGSCLLKSIDPSTRCNIRSWNHIVAETFLSLITTKDKVLYWDIFSGKMLAIQSMVNGKLGRRMVQEIADFKPNLIGIVNDSRCQIKGSCNHHDNKAFELIETPLKFNAGNRQHQTIIGMRAAFAEAAFLANTKQWLKGRVRGKPRAVYLAFLKIGDSRKQSVARLEEWISTVERNALDEVQTTYWTERLPIAIAACGTSNRNDSYSAPTINLMPRMDGDTDILISTRANDTKGQENKDVAEIERLTNIIKSLKDEPARGIELLIRTIDQVFLNPEQFNDNRILTEEERTVLKEGISRYRAEEFQRTNQLASAKPYLDLAGRPRSLSSSPAPYYSSE